MVPAPSAAPPLRGIGGDVMAGRGRNKRARGNLANLETHAGGKAIARVRDLLREASPGTDVETIHDEVIHLAQAYYQDLEMTWVQSPKVAAKKLANVSTQAGALISALRGMGGLAGAYYTDLIDQEMAALARDMETIQKIEARARRLVEFIEKNVVRKGQATPAKPMVRRCCKLLEMLRIPYGDLPPKIGRAVHEAVTLQMEKDMPQQFDAAWDELCNEMKSDENSGVVVPSSDAILEMY